MKLNKIPKHKLKKMSHKELCDHFIKVMMFKVKVGAYLEEVEKELYKYN